MHGQQNFKLFGKSTLLYVSLSLSLSVYIYIYTYVHIIYILLHNIYYILYIN